jgi:hypothetical protein
MVWFYQSKNKINKLPYIAPLRTRVVNDLRYSWIICPSFLIFAFLGSLLFFNLLGAFLALTF